MWARIALVLTCLALVASPVAPVVGVEQEDNEPSGETLYNGTCGLCHGPEGSGDAGPRIAPMGSELSEVLDIVRNGNGQMPAISADELSDAEVARVVDYLRSLGDSPGRRDADVSRVDDAAAALIKNGVTGVAEGANMPSTPEAMNVFIDAGVLFGPAKAANAGGVAVSGLEQSQNALRISWSHDEVEARLVAIMEQIHTRCLEYGSAGGLVNYVNGANLAGFEKVARAMLAYGCV
jgi:mono/diheme cytochrome c family protein